MGFSLVENGVLEKVSFLLLLVIFELNTYVVDFIGNQLLESLESFFEDFDFGLVLAGDCGSFFPLNMKSVFESDFLSPADVNQETNKRD